MKNNLFKVFRFGPCDIYNPIKYFREIMESQANHSRSLYKTSIDFDNFNYRNHLYSTSLRSLYSKPGPIAQRVYETLLKINQKDLKDYHYYSLEESMKYPFLDFFKKHATKNDVLLLSFSTELYTKLQVKDECITLHPSLFPLRNKINDKLNWLFNNFYLSDRFLLPFDNERNSVENIDYIKQFSKDISEIFQERIILLDIHVSNIVYDDKTDAYSTLTSGLNKYCHFYSPSRLDAEAKDTISRYSRIFVNRFLKEYPYDIPLVSIDRNKCFIDANHPLGLAPFHFYKSTNYLIGLEIYKELLKHEEKIKNRNNKLLF